MRKAPQSLHLLTILLFTGFAALMVSLWPMPTEAQDFFATNTPLPPTPIIITPDAPIDNYALRIWLESDMLTVLFNQIQRLSANDSGIQRAVQLTQYEIQHRFPGAPRDVTQRERLLSAMLSAPRGSVDMRGIVRPFIQDAFNQQPDADTFSANGFTVEVAPANVDGHGGTDALLHIAYVVGTGDTAQILYEEYVLAIRDANNQFRIVPATPDYPVAPFGMTRSLRLERLADVNRDGLDELAVIVNDGAVNERLVIMGFRNDVVIDLVQPNEQIRFGQLVSWPVGDATIVNPPLSVLNSQLESAAWSCLSEIPVSWVYSANYYRPQIAENSRYRNQDSLACTLYEAEPLFALPPGDAIEIVQNALARFSPTDPGGDRAQMTLAMLYVTNGQLSEAATLAQSLNGPDGSWVINQSIALQSALGISSNTPLTICEALLIANPDGACDTNALLARYFRDNPPTREQDVVEQLTSLGLPVLETTTISEVGRVNRTAVSFNIVGTGWWTFAPLGPNNTYVAEAIEPPVGFEAAILPAGLVEVPDAAYNELFISRNPLGALNAIDNAIRLNPGIPLTPEARFVQALSYDLVGDRTRAKNAYFDIWVTYPNTVWGQLAGQHLERR